MTLYSLLFLFLVSVPFFFIQRWLHREIQLVLMLLTRRLDLSLALFSILFFPGVLLHEGSHYVAARLLGVRTGRVSLFPKALEGGKKLQMGYVETYAADPLRETLIGAAPLIAGGLFVAFAGLVQLGLLDLWSVYTGAGADAVPAALPALTRRPDFWIWLYLAFVVSSTMLPSAADRRAWLPVLGVIAVLVAVILFSGAGATLSLHMAPLLERALLAVTIVFGISLALHLLLVTPLWLIRRLLMWAMRLEIASPAA